MKSLEITHKEWYRIRDTIRAEHGDSMVLIREKMRRELGFLPRNHVMWTPKMDGGYYDKVIMIDFFTEEARTWFLLKFT